jgi:hypothetical protein
MTDTTWLDAYGALSAYPDIPAEYLTGLSQGRLGDWLQEVVDAGWMVAFEDSLCRISQDNPRQHFTGTAEQPDIAFVRAYLAWKGRAG